MTEPKELKPCPFCKQVPSIKNTSAGLFWVGCSNEWITPVHYKIATILFDTEAEAIAAWNNYVAPAPAPKWTDEPEEEGWYWVLIGQCRGMTLVNVVEEEDELFVHHRGNPEIMSVSDYETTFHVHGWLYIPFPEPPLPAEREE